MRCRTGLALAALTFSLQGLPALAQNAAVAPVERVSEEIRFPAQHLSTWTQQDAQRIEQEREHTIPLFLVPDQPFDENHYLWDHEFVRDKNTGEVVRFGDWLVMVSLSSERRTSEEDPFFGRSQWRYWLEREGEWRYGGLVFPEGTALGSRQWAGSTYYDPETGRIHFYYTATGRVEDGGEAGIEALPEGHPGEGRDVVVQQMVEASAVPVVEDAGVTFTDFSDHDVILEADGETYMTQEQYVDLAEEVIYGMRDPWFYRDPVSGDDIILFTANSAAFEDTYNGVVGLARLVEGEWTLEEPVLLSTGTSSQLERPHFIRTADGLYLFFSTHQFTYWEGETGPEGLYGFYSESGDVRGPYVPLNGHGLVAGNPEVAPFQSYSYYVLPDLSVLTYLNEAINFQPESEGDFFGGPGMFKIALNGATGGVDLAQERLGEVTAPVDPEQGGIADDPTENAETNAGAAGATGVGDTGAAVSAEGSAAPSQ